jgi:hypothetical protein
LFEVFKWFKWFKLFEGELRRQFEHGEALRALDPGAGSQLVISIATQFEQEFLFEEFEEFKLFKG